MKRYPMVLVRWIDSSSRAGWQNRKKATRQMGAKDAQCVTAGFLLRKSKNRLILALNMADTGEAGHLMSIPRVAIKRVRKLKRG